jgi:hypothetical protein
MDTKKIKRFVAGFVLVNSVTVEWGCSCAYALESKVREAVLAPSGKIEAKSPLVRPKSESLSTVDSEKLLKNSPLMRKSWDRFFTYDSQTKSMVLVPPEKQKDYSKSGMAVIDFRSNIESLYAAKCRFLVPNNKGNDYDPDHSQNGTYVALPVPVFLPACGEYRYPARSGDDGKKDEIDVSRFGKDKSDVLQVQGNILLGVIFPESQVTELTLHPNAMADAKNMADAKKKDGENLAKFAQIECPSNVENVLNNVVSLGLNQRYSLKVGSKFQESIVVYRRNDVWKRWFFFAACAAKVNNLISINSGCSFSLSAGFNGLVGCPFTKLFADKEFCCLIDDYLFGGRSNYQAMNLDQNDGCSFSVLASQGWKNHVNGVGGVVAWPVYYGMPGVSVSLDKTIVLTTLCDMKGKNFVTHHIFLSKNDTAMFEKALVEGCFVEKNDDLTRLAHVILVAGKECLGLRLCATLLDSYPGGKFRDAFENAMAVYNAKRLLANTAEEAKRKREADESAARRAAEEARYKREADESAARRSNEKIGSALASKAVAPRMIDNVGRKNVADGSFVKKATAVKGQKAGVGVRGVSNSSRKSAVKRNRSTTKKSAAARARSSTANSKRKFSTRKKTKRDNRTTTVRRVRNRRR